MFRVMRTFVKTLLELQEIGRYRRTQSHKAQVTSVSARPSSQTLSLVACRQPGHTYERLAITI